ncbi:hypothetical protein FGO68_gene6305 [Halteria grandinella]|uniref:Uncharacterized protein n=1 Tax=Halteria grandinella TaxID=5974 RepID=A0A8J8NTE8_HALGN|nr:hypothetical protein FGO68_gene6305 [Halteria grandinella]
MLTGACRVIREFMVSPDAFVFIYERDMFVCLHRDGRVEMWSTEGYLVSDFGGREMYTYEKPSAGESNGGKTNVINLSTSRRYLFTVLKDDPLPSPENPESSELSFSSPSQQSRIKVIDLQTGKEIGEMACPWGEISYVHYIEGRHQMITGHSDGGLMIWQ